MLSTPDLMKVIDIASESEKQNKIEGIELEAMGALRTSISGGSAALGKALNKQITELSKSGLVSVRSQAQELLQNLQRSDLHALQFAGLLPDQHEYDGWWAAPRWWTSWLLTSMSALWRFIWRWLIKPGG